MKKFLLQIGMLFIPVTLIALGLAGYAREVLMLGAKASHADLLISALIPAATIVTGIASLLGFMKLNGAFREK